MLKRYETVKERKERKARTIREAIKINRGLFGIKADVFNMPITEQQKQQEDKEKEDKLEVQYLHDFDVLEMRAEEKEARRAELEEVEKVEDLLRLGSRLELQRELEDVEAYDAWIESLGIRGGRKTRGWKKKKNKTNKKKKRNKTQRGFRRLKSRTRT